MYSFMEVLNWKKNKKVCTICFEVWIPMKKQKITREFFNVGFQKKYLYLDSTILFWTKIFMEMLLFHQKVTEK